MKLRQIIFIIIFISILLVIPFLIKDKKVDIDEIKKVFEEYAKEDIVVEIDSSTIYNNYNINTNSLEGYISYGPITYMNVQELTVFKEDDKDKRIEIKNEINEYINKKILTFGGYGEAQVELLKNSVVEIKGDYVFCIILDNSDEVWQNITKLF